MKLLSSLLFASTLSLSAGTALAACPGDMASAGATDPTTTAGIAKDGSRAPLEGAVQPAIPDGDPAGGDRFAATSQDVEAQQAGPGAADWTDPGNLTAGDTTGAPLSTNEPGTAGQAAGNLIAKDGSTMPLAERPGGGDTDLAMSQQDAEAQQEGQETAAAAADDTRFPAERGTADQAGGGNLIAKDGSRAPLEAGPGEGGGNLIAKDGSTMPLAEQPGGGDTDLAMSQQDAEAQQEGGQTAAAAAFDDECEE
jgi:hypothetical protein